MILEDRAKALEEDDAPAKLSAPKCGSGVTVEWSAVKGAKSYNLKYSTDGKNWKTVSVSGTSYTLKPASGKKCSYAVQAVAGSKKSAWSKTKTVTVT